MCKKLMHQKKLINVKDKDDCAGIPVSSTKINEQIDDYRHQKRQQFDLFKKTARSEVSDESCTINDLSSKGVKQPTGTCVIVGNHESMKKVQ